MSLWIVDATSDEIADMEYWHDKLFWPVKVEAVENAKLTISGPLGNIIKYAEGKKDER